MNENPNLMKCPTCEKKISRKATSCPNCGHGFSSGALNLSDPVHFIGVVLAVILGLGVVWWMIDMAG